MEFFFRIKGFIMIRPWFFPGGRKLDGLLDSASGSQWGVPVVAYKYYLH